MMQQNSSPDCRFHTNQPRKFTKTFSQLLKCTKRFSLQTSANLQHDDYWERIFPWTPTQRMTSRGCGGKKKNSISTASTYHRTSLLSSWNGRSGGTSALDNSHFMAGFSSRSHTKVWPCFLPSPTQDVVSRVSLHVETRERAASTNKVALLYYGCHGVVG